MHTGHSESEEKSCTLDRNTPRLISFTQLRFYFPEFITDGIIVLDWLGVWLGRYMDNTNGIITDFGINGFHRLSETINFLLKMKVSVSTCFHFISSVFCRPNFLRVDYVFDNSASNWSHFSNNIIQR